MVTRRKKNVTDNLLAITKHNTRSETVTNGGENLETIPLDLIFEILSRLPANSIARCRCVSNLWTSILLRPYFTELFLTRSSARPRLLITCARNGDLFLFSSSQVRNPNENSSIVATNHHMKFLVRKSSKIHGHVHGLVCLTVANGWERTVLVIYNPSTRQFFSLSKWNTVGTSVDSFIGYDPIDKQYKVLSLTSPSRRTDLISVKYQVSTLGTKKLSWRTVECCFPHHSESGGICINGVLYYMATIDELPRQAITCFDVRSEEYPFFNIDEGMKFWYYAKLVNYAGKIGVLLADGFNGLTTESTCFELWVLVDVEKHEWSKHVYTLLDSWTDHIY